MYLRNYYKENLELGVTVFKFEFPGSPEQFIETVEEWMTLTKEGNRYYIKDHEEDTLLKIQRGKGIVTAPIVFEFKVGAALGLPTEMIVICYVELFSMRRFLQDLRPDAHLGFIPRRNGWNDILKLLYYVNVTFYNYEFYPSLESVPGIGNP